MVNKNSEEDVSVTQKILRSASNLSHTEAASTSSKDQVEKAQITPSCTQATSKSSLDLVEKAQIATESSEEQIATQDTVMDTSTPPEMNNAPVEEDEEIKKLRTDTANLLDNVLER